VQPPQRARAFVQRFDRVGDETSAEALVQRRRRFVDERRIEREDLERPRRIAPQIAVHLAGLREAERPGRLHALATVDARERPTRAREAHAIVGLHSAMKLRGLRDAEVGDAGTDGARAGGREHASIVAPEGGLACAFLAVARTPKIARAVKGTLRRMNQEITALVTGANKGIGLETARRLAGLGMTVLVGARDRGRGESAVARLRTSSPDVHFVLLDVADDASVARAAADVTARFGRLDVLVNNAAIATGGGPPSTQRVGAMRELFATNLFGLVAVTQAFLPLLEEAPAARIVNVSSSIGSLRLAADLDHAVSRQSALFGYSASKTAVNAFTVRLANELRAKTLKVNAACPGFVATDLNHHSGTRTVEQGAEIIVRLATLPSDGPTGGFFDDAGTIPW
jgi:NAD(P)-dependent dehydrogenase (short-subunit alcohol dehydrogenase family)